MRFVTGRWDIVDMPDAHVDFGSREVMRRIANVLEKEL